MLLGWNSLLLQQLRLPAAAKAAARLVGSQAGLLDSLSDSGPPWSRVAAAPAAVLKAKPALLSDYTALVTSSGEHLIGTCTSRANGQNMQGTYLFTTIMSP